MPWRVLLLQVQVFDPSRLPILGRQEVLGQPTGPTARLGPCPDCPAGADPVLRVDAHAFIMRGVMLMPATELSDHLRASFASNQCPQVPPYTG